MNKIIKREFEKGIRMKRIILKHTFLILVSVLLLSLIMSSFGFIYFNREALFDDSFINRKTIIDLRIDAYFEIEEIKEIVEEVVQYDKKRISVEIDKNNKNKVLIKTDLIDVEKQEELINKFLEKYGEDMEVSAIMNVSNVADYRPKIFLVICIILAISIGLLVLCFTKLKKIHQV